MKTVKMNNETSQGEAEIIKLTNVEV